MIAQLGERQTEDLKVPGSSPGEDSLFFSVKDINILQFILNFIVEFEVIYRDIYRHTEDQSLFNLRNIAIKIAI